jgi:hypothetical protein
MGEPDGPRPLTVVTDASDGDHPAFLRGLDDRQVAYVMGAVHSTSVQP